MKRKKLHTVNVTADYPGINVGNRVTMAGYKIHKSGRINTKCKPGKETVFIVKKEKQ